MRITHYRFGELYIDGIHHEADLMVLPNGDLVEPWRRKADPWIDWPDIAAVIDRHPRRLIVGTGFHGRLLPVADLEEELTVHEITLEALPTTEAVAVFNRAQRTGERVAAAFHLR